MARSEDPKPQEVICRFETVRGNITIKSTIYKLPLSEADEPKRPWIEADRIMKAKREAEYRAEQLEPPRPKRERIERDPVHREYEDEVIASGWR